VDALDLSRSCDDWFGVARALDVLIAAATHGGDFSSALSNLEEREAIEKEFRLHQGPALIAFHAGDIARLRGDFAAADALLQRGLDGFRRTGNYWMEGFVLSSLALLARSISENEQASSYLKQCYFRRYEAGIGNLVGPWILEMFAGMLVDDGKPEQATRLFGAAEKARETEDNPMPAWDAPQYEADLDAIDRVVAEGRRRELWEAGRSTALEEAIDEALRSQF